MNQQTKINWMERLGKWRTLFAGWQLGTRPKGDPESDAVRDHREITLALRAEVNAQTVLLLEKGIFTAAEFTNQMNEQARLLCEHYEKRFPGAQATDDGLAIDSRAVSWLSKWRP